MIHLATRLQVLLQGMASQLTDQKILIPDGTGVEFPVRGKELGRDIPLQIPQVGFGISVAKHFC